MPASLDAERSILGAVLLDNDVYPQAAESLKAEDFSLDSHRRIYMRMTDLNTTGRPVDIIEMSDGSLLVSDDEAGVIYSITYRE